MFPFPVRCAQNRPLCRFLANLAAWHSYKYAFSSQDVKERWKQDCNKLSSVVVHHLEGGSESWCANIQAFCVFLRLVWFSTLKLAWNSRSSIPKSLHRLSFGWVSFSLYFVGFSLFWLFVLLLGARRLHFSSHVGFFLGVPGSLRNSWKCCKGY